MVLPSLLLFRAAQTCGRETSWQVLMAHDKEVNNHDGPVEISVHRRRGASWNQRRSLPERTWHGCDGCEASDSLGFTSLFALIWHAASTMPLYGIRSFVGTLAC